MVKEVLCVYRGEGRGGEVLVHLHFPNFKFFSNELFEIPW